jgi:micrococcal nuclease
MAIIAWKTGTLPGPWTGRAVHWYDGDTLYMLGGDVRGVVRIYGIDAPEWGQKGCAEARAALKHITRTAPVIVTPIQLDRYGRIVAKLLDRTGHDVGQTMLENGLAWWEYRWAPQELAYHAAQTGARARKLGLWQSHPWGFAPWVWRKRHRTGA